MIKVLDQVLAGQLDFHAVLSGVLQRGPGERLANAAAAQLLGHFRVVHLDFVLADGLVVYARYHVVAQVHHEAPLVLVVPDA